MKNIKWITLIVFGFLLVTLIPLTDNVSATDLWYNTSYIYRKALNVTGKILGCQMKILIGNTSGGNVTCNSHVKNDFSDLAFTDISGNLLPFWIENYTTGVQSTVWINNTQNVSKFYMYYGYSLAPSLSNGNTTFPFFDDFNGTSLNLQKWNRFGTTTESFSNSVLTITNGGGGVIRYIYSKNSFGKNYMLHYKWKIQTGSRSIGIGFNIYNGSAGTSYFSLETGGATNTGTYWSNAGATGSETTNFYTSYRIVDFKRSSTRLFTYMNGTKKADTSSNVPVASMPITIGEIYDKADTCYGVFDYIFVKKFWDIEPLWSSFGAEERYSYPNSKPNNSNNSPLNNTMCISYPIISITISDINANYMNHTFRTNYSGSWKVLKYTNHTLNATITYTGTYTTNKTIYWSSNVTDNRSLWDNNTFYFYVFKVPSHNISFINNHINTTWTHQYKYDINSGYIIYDNDTGNTSTTLKLYLFENIFNATGFHNYTLNSTGYTVYANYTGNCSSIDCNSSGLWLYLGAMLTLDNGQFFLLILIGLWSYFIYLFYREKEVIFAFCIICCGLPLGIILSGVAYYNSYPFGYLISFILIIISFLIPTYSMYQKNKKKKK